MPPGFLQYIQRNECDSEYCDSAYVSSVCILEKSIHWFCSFFVVWCKRCQCVLVNMSHLKAPHLHDVCCSQSCRSQSHSRSFTLLKEFLSMHLARAYLDSFSQHLHHGNGFWSQKPPLRWAHPLGLGVTKMVPSIFWKYPPVEVRVSLHLPRTVFPVDRK